AVGYDVANGEVLSLLHYRPGQRYKPHFDCISTEQANSAEGLEQGGQRILTVLLSMGDDQFIGGETYFPKLGVSVKINSGELLRFNNADEDGQPLTASLHEGRPVESGEKWLFSKWVRQSPTPYGRELSMTH
ncbi:MAG: 2OG-Fe(II) oxygenase, partial [Woeseia sp.]